MLTPEDIIQNLKPCHYKYNDKLALGDKLNFGFLAQDILDDFGENYNFVVKNENDEFYKINYYQFISPLVSLVQEQQKDIKYLKEELRKLKMKGEV